MKPIRNRVFCLDCKGTKMLFATEAKANNFIRFNTDEILEETGKAPVRSYYCESCGGWHVTSNPAREYFEKKELIDAFDLEKCKKNVINSINKLQHAYTLHEFIECYQYIEEAYTEIEKAQKANVAISEFEESINCLEKFASIFRKLCPYKNPKKNASMKRLDKLSAELKNAAHSFTEDFSACKEIIELIEIELQNAVRYGASKKALKQYYKIHNRYSSSQKIKLRVERNELYKQIVSNFKKQDYSICSEAIRLSYLNFYASLNEGVSEEDIRSAIKHIEPFKEFVENWELTTKSQP